MNRTILTLALCLSCASVGAQNLVVNGDFDTDLSGWLIDPSVTQPLPGQFARTHGFGIQQPRAVVIQRLPQTSMTWLRR